MLRNGQLVECPLKHCDRICCFLVHFLGSRAMCDDAAALVLEAVLPCGSLACDAHIHRTLRCGGWI